MRIRRKKIIEAAADENDEAQQRKIIRLGVDFYDDAIVRLEKVLRTKSDDRDLRTKLVDLHFYRGNWAGAIDHIKFFVSTPSDVTALAKLFDRFDLWKRISPPVPENQDPKVVAGRISSPAITAR